MRALIIDENIKEGIAKVIDYAQNHIFSFDDVIKIIAGQATSAGLIPGHCIKIPIGFNVVYSLEQQKQFLVKHLSISIDREGKLPNEIAVREIMKLFGFKNSLEECMVQILPCGPDWDAINVFELPDMANASSS